MLFVINLILGIGLLLAGRRLFWLFIAAAGFFAGVELVNRFWQGSEVVALLVGIVIGVLFALLAMGIKSIAISIAGFLLGGSAALSLASTFGFETGLLILYIIGGVAGLIFISAFFDWALIVISSFTGASIIADTINVNSAMAGLVFIALLIAGIVIQSRDTGGIKSRDG